MPTATYVYCLARSARKPAAARAPSGVPGASPVEVVRLTSSIYVIAAQVPLETYSGTHLERVLGDLEQVGRIAMGHEEVVEYIAGRTGVTVVPMKLFTLFSSPARAVSELAARRKEIESAIRRIGGAEEWGIRITRAAPSKAAAPGREVRVTGTAFLGARKQARDEVRAARMAAAAAASRTFESLAALARDARVRRDATPAGASPPLLDAALLVPVRSRARFKTAARREAAACARAGASLVLTGPWPAYNFVSAAEPSR